MSVEKEIRRVTTKALDILKHKKIKITALTAYDFITAKISSTFVVTLLISFSTDIN